MDETIIIILAGCAVLAIGLLIWIASQASFRLNVTPSPLAVTHYDAVDVMITLECKRRLGLRWAAVPGTFIVHRGPANRVGVSRTLGMSEPDGWGFPLQVIGLQPGEDAIRVSATPNGRKNAVVAAIPVVVNEDDRGVRRIRHTAVALTERMR